MTIRPCDKCGKNNWTPIPDSLALHCECGEVIVQSGQLDGTYERGASLQEWAKDLYESQQSAKEER